MRCIISRHMYILILQTVVMTRAVGEMTVMMMTKKRSAHDVNGHTSHHNNFRNWRQHLPGTGTLTWLPGKRSLPGPI